VVAFFRDTHSVTEVHKKGGGTKESQLAASRAREAAVSSAYKPLVGLKQLGAVGGGEGRVWVGADGSPALGGFARTPTDRQRATVLVLRRSRGWRWRAPVTWAVARAARRCWSSSCRTHRWATGAGVDGCSAWRAPQRMASLGPCSWACGQPRGRASSPQSALARKAGELEALGLRGGGADSAVASVSAAAAAASASASAAQLEALRAERDEAQQVGPPSSTPSQRLLALPPA
jgi:hypothetical protein